MQEIVLESGDEASADEYGVDECVGLLCGREEEESVSEKFSRASFGKEAKRMCAHRGNGKDSSGREKTLKQKEMGVSVGAEVSVDGGGIGEKNMFAITDKNRLTGGRTRG